MAQPTSKVLMDLSKDVLENLKIKYSYGGIYLAMEGPQLSQSRVYTIRSWNCDVIGMTNMPEAQISKRS